MADRQMDVNLKTLDGAAVGRVNLTNLGHNMEESTCKPKTVIVFHKTHKCSSTTIQNILLRYAHYHQLNVVLPVKLYHLLADNGFKAR